MKRNEPQNQRITAIIFQEVGALVRSACENSLVPPAFLAGLISVEAGWDTSGHLNPHSTRFEKGVYEDLVSLRDKGYCYIGGLLSHSYNGIGRSQIADASDDALVALSKSYGLTQVMGYWALYLGCTLDELRDPQKHLFYAVKLLGIWGNDDFPEENYQGLLRQWNSGSETGKTHDPAYVTNALAVMSLYEALERAASPVRPEAVALEIRVRKLRERIDSITGQLDLIEAQLKKEKI